MPRPQPGAYHIVAGKIALCIAAKCSTDRLLGVILCPKAWLHAPVLRPVLIQ
jgi:hypothetical protein